MTNRYICSVFDEMRVCQKTHNYSYLYGLIEEAQVLANRMEASLSDQHDIEWKTKELRRLKEEIKEAKRERDSIETKKS